MTEAGGASRAGQVGGASRAGQVGRASRAGQVGRASQPSEVGAQVTDHGGPPLDRVDGIGYRLYRRVCPPESGFVSWFEEKGEQAMLSGPVELYLSRALLLALAVWVGCTLLGFGVGTVLFGRSLLGANTAAPGGLGGPVRALVGGVAIGTVGAAVTLLAAVVRPYLQADDRRREINVLLPDAVAYMYALSEGGLNQLEIVASVADAEDTYGEVSREFQRIVRDSAYFDVDYRTAIRTRALATPSDELSQFLSDMLSIIDSGGDMVGFLDDKKETHMRTAKRQQEATLDTLELLGEVYIAVSLFPLLLIVLLVIMGLMGTTRLGMLFATVYGLIPISSLTFLVIVSMVKQDDPGDGYLAVESTGRGTGAAGGVDARRAAVDQFVAGRSLFDRIGRGEWMDEAVRRLKRPHAFFRQHPRKVLWVTIPLSVVAVAYAVAVGAAPTTWSGMVRRPVVGTVALLYVPLYVNLVPLAAFYEWHVRTRRPITNELTAALRKLSSANNTGLTLLESIRTVADTSDGRLAAEFRVVCSKVRYGRSLGEALVEFNNAYGIPRVARTVRLVSKAQETSSRITNVLTTAAQASENHDDMARERRLRSRMQVAVILLTYVTMLAVVIILKTEFIDLITGVLGSVGTAGPERMFSGGVDPSVLLVLLLHAVTIQAVLTGVISGYIQETNLPSGAKYVVALSTVTLGVWVVV